tara:strand:+ start:7355 stop:8224 length:870 start_codon:yes stop_codon:yes gene_type:complete
MIKSYVISIPERTDRLESLRQEFDWEYEVVDGIDGHTLDYTSLIKRGKISKHFYSPFYGICTKGVYGAAFAHYNAWKTFLETEEEECLILEDDVRFTPNKLTFEHSLNQRHKLTLPYKIIFFGRCAPYVNGKPIEGTDFIWAEYGSGHFGAQCYLLTRKGAQELIDNFFPIRHAVDVYLDEILHTRVSVKESLVRGLGHINQQQFLDYRRTACTKPDSDTHENYFLGWKSKEMSNRRVQTAFKRISVDFDLVDSVDEVVDQEIQNQTPEERQFIRFILKEFHNVTGNTE